MASGTTLSPVQVEKLLTKSIKQLLTGCNLHSTRSGSKELGFLVKEIRSAPFTSQAEVQKAGSAIAQKIIELSQASDKPHLDAGVICKIRFKPGWSASFNIPEKLPTQPIAKKKPTKSDQIVVIPPSSSQAAQDIADQNISKGREVKANSTSDDNIVDQLTPDTVVTDDLSGETMRDINAEKIDKSAIAPEIAATEPSSAEAQALLANESDESQTMSSSSDGPPEPALSEETAGVEDAAKAEVLEAVNSAPGGDATTAVPVDPEAAALARGVTTPEGEEV